MNAEKKKIKTEKKKMNTYVKYIGIVLLCGLIGGITGASSPALLNTGLGSAVQWLVDAVCRHQLPILSVLTVTAVAVLEYMLFEICKKGKRMSAASDEECDILEYEIDKAGTIGVVISNLFMVLLILVLSTGFSMEYLNSLEDSAGSLYLAALVVFIAASLYGGIWQVRYVKAVQKIYPEKKGDPASMKFQKQWMESCDEAEKEVIYQSSYKTYLTIMKVIPILLLVAMLGHFIWNTGIMAILMVGIIWIVANVTYSRSCLIKKGQKIGKD